jgi:UDP-N-acetylmuramoyl-tripeptide--D-alanyl-D-alanine ligase
MTILSSLAEQHRFAVLEMGAFRAGDIAALCKLAPPHVGVVTNVGGAHLESFGSLDNTAIAKGELIESLPAHGLAVLNVDDPRVRAMVFRSKAPSVLYGLGDGAQYTGAIDRLTPNGMQFHWRGPYDGDVATSQLIGRHNLRNMLAAIAVAQQCGLDRATIAAGLAAAQPVESRTQIKRAVSGSTIIDDSYNANRASMLAGLDTLRDLAPLDHRWAVLGDMYELGDHAEAEHRAVGAAAAASVGHLYAVGTLARWIAEGAIEAGMPPSRVLHLAAPGDEGFRASPIPAPAVAASRQQLATELLSRLTPADVVLVKAAHGMRLDFVVHLLQAEQPAH